MLDHGRILQNQVVSLLLREFSRARSFSSGGKGFFRQGGPFSQGTVAIHSSGNRLKDPDEQKRPTIKASCKDSYANLNKYQALEWIGE